MPPQHHPQHRQRRHHHRHPPQDRGDDGKPSTATRPEAPAASTDGTSARAAAKSSERRSGEEPAERGGGGDVGGLGRKRRQWGGDRPDHGGARGAGIATPTTPTRKSPPAGGRAIDEDDDRRPAGRGNGLPSYLSPTKSSRRRSRPATAPNGVVGGVGGGGTAAPAPRSSFVFGATAPPPAGEDGDAADHSPDRRGRGWRGPRGRAVAVAASAGNDSTTTPSPRKRRSGGAAGSGGGMSTRERLGEAYSASGRRSGPRPEDDPNSNRDGDAPSSGGDRGERRRRPRHRSHPSDEGRALHATGDDNVDKDDDDGSNLTPHNAPPSFPGVTGGDAMPQLLPTNRGRELSSSPQLSLFATPQPKSPHATATDGEGAVSSPSPRIRRPPAPISSAERPAPRGRVDDDDAGGPAAEDFRRDLDDVLDRWTELRGELLRILPSSTRGGVASSRTNGDLIGGGGGHGGDDDDEDRRRRAAAMLERVRDVDDGLRRLGRRVDALGDGGGANGGGGLTLRRSDGYPTSFTSEEVATATTYSAGTEDLDGEENLGLPSPDGGRYRSTTTMVPKTSSSPGMKFVMELSESIGLDAGQHLLLSDIMDRHCVLPEGGGA